MLRPPSDAAQLPEIESLRGIAVALVVLGHTNSWVTWRPVAAPVDANLLSAFVHAGHTGVSLFLVISAFLLARPFLEEAAGGRRVDRRSYATRRALRILPLYWSAVLVTALVCTRGWIDIAGTLQYLFFLNGFDGRLRPFLPYSSVWWSLATEVQFYVLLPLLPLLLRARRGRAVGLVLLVAYAAGCAAFAHGWRPRLSPAGLNVLTHSVLGRAPLFLAGIAAACVWRRRAGLQAWIARQRWRQRRRQGWRQGWLRDGGADLLFLVLVLALAVVLQAVARVGYVGAELGHIYWHAAEGILWAAVMLMLLLAPLRLKPLLCNRWLATIGLLSYSIYLTHMPILYQGLTRLGMTNGWTPASAAACVALWAVTLAVSGLTYRLLERPWLRRKAGL